MKILKDIFSGSELGSDSYPTTEEGCVLVLEGKMITKEEGDYGIAANVDDEAAEGAAAESLEQTKAQA